MGSATHCILAFFGLLLPAIPLEAQDPPETPEQLLAIVDAAAGRLPGAITLGDHLVEYECEMRSTARVDSDKGMDDLEVVPFEEPRVSRFRLRVARLGERELIDFRGIEVDPYHQSQPFGQDMARLFLGGDDGGVQVYRRTGQIVRVRSAAQFSPLLLRPPTSLPDTLLSSDLAVLFTTIPPMSPRKIQEVRESIRVVRDAVRTTRGNITVEETMSTNMMTVAGAPYTIRRITTYSPRHGMMPVAVHTESGGRIGSSWEIAWETADDAGWRPTVITAIHHFHVKESHEMGRVTFRITAERPLTERDAEDVFRIEE